MDVEMNGGYYPLLGLISIFPRNKFPFLPTNLLLEYPILVALLTLKSTNPRPTGVTHLVMSHIELNPTRPGPVHKTGLQLHSTVNSKTPTTREQKRNHKTTNRNEDAIITHVF